MNIGLVILGIAAVMIFFGAAERYFEMLGITSWLSFIVIFALVLGAVVPDISISGTIVSIGGFIVPIVVAIVLIAISFKKTNTLRVLPSTVLIASLAVGIRVLMKPEITSEAILGCSLIIGFAAGAVSFLFASDRTATLITSLSGIIIGDIIASSLSANANPLTNLVFGGNAVFDSMIIACAFGLVMYEGVNVVRNTHLSKTAKANLNTEAAEDVVIDEAAANNGEKPAEQPNDKKKHLDYLDD